MSEATRCPFCGTKIIQIGATPSHVCGNENCEMSSIPLLITTWKKRHVCKDKHGKPVTTADDIMCITPTGAQQKGRIFWDDEDFIWRIRVHPQVSHKLSIMSSIELIESEVTDG